MEEDDNKIAEWLNDLLNRLFATCDDELKAYIQTHPEDVKLSMPKIFIDILVDYMKNVLVVDLNRDGRHYYRGVEVIQNYEMTVVLFHKDCTRINGWKLNRKFYISTRQIEDLSHFELRHDVFGYIKTAPIDLSVFNEMPGDTIIDNRPTEWSPAPGDYINSPNLPERK